MSLTYSTSQIAKMVGLHPNTVRMYEEWGLIQKPFRKKNGYRVYDENDMNRLKIIRSLRCANYWSCLLNDFYKLEEPNPHMHLHVRPRYKNPVEINNHSYIDAEYAHHYALKKESVLLEEDRQTLYEIMKGKFGEIL